MQNLRHSLAKNLGETMIQIVIEPEVVQAELIEGKDYSFKAKSLRDHSHLS